MGEEFPRKAERKGPKAALSRHTWLIVGFVTFALLLMSVLVALFQRRISVQSVDGRPLLVAAPEDSTADYSNRAVIPVAVGHVGSQRKNSEASLKHSKQRRAAKGNKSGATVSYPVRMGPLMSSIKNNATFTRTKVFVDAVRDAKGTTDLVSRALVRRSPGSVPSRGTGARVSESTAAHLVSTRLESNVSGITTSKKERIDSVTTGKSVAARTYPIPVVSVTLGGKTTAWPGKESGTKAVSSTTGPNATTVSTNSETRSSSPSPTGHSSDSTINTAARPTPPKAVYEGRVTTILRETYDLSGSQLVSGATVMPTGNMFGNRAPTVEFAANVTRLAGGPRSTWQRRFGKRAGLLRVNITLSNGLSQTATHGAAPWNTTALTDTLSQVNQSDRKSTEVSVVLPGRDSAPSSFRTVTVKSIPIAEGDQTLSPATELLCTAGIYQSSSYTGWTEKEGTLTAVRGNILRLLDSSIAPNSTVAGTEPTINESTRWVGRTDSEKSPHWTTEVTVRSAGAVDTTLFTNDSKPTPSGSENKSALNDRTKTAKGPSVSERNLKAARKLLEEEMRKLYDALLGRIATRSTKTATLPTVAGTKPSPARPFSRRSKRVVHIHRFTVSKVPSTTEAIVENVRSKPTKKRKMRLSSRTSTGAVNAVSKPSSAAGSIAEVSAGNVTTSERHSTAPSVAASYVDEITAGNVTATETASFMTADSDEERTPRNMTASEESGAVATNVSWSLEDMAAGSVTAAEERGRVAITVPGSLSVNESEKYSTVTNNASLSGQAVTLRNVTASGEHSRAAFNVSRSFEEVLPLNTTASEEYSTVSAVSTNVTTSPPRTSRYRESSVATARLTSPKRVRWKTLLYTRKVRKTTVKPTTTTTATAARPPAATPGASPAGTPATPRATTPTTTAKKTTTTEIDMPVDEVLPPGAEAEKEDSTYLPPTTVLQTQDGDDAALPRYITSDEEWLPEGHAEEKSTKPTQVTAEPPPSSTTTTSNSSPASLTPGTVKSAVTTLRTSSETSASSGTRSSTRRVREREISTICVYHAKHTGWQTSNVTYSLDTFPFPYCSVVVYCCVHFQARVQIERGDARRNVDFKKLMRVKKDHPTLKTLVAVGGERADSSTFKLIVRNETNAENFVAVARTWLEARDLDGLYLYWTYPESSDKYLFVQASARLAAQLGRVNLTVGVILPVDEKHLAGFDIPALIQTFASIGSSVLLSPPEFEEQIYNNMLVHRSNILAQRYVDFLASTHTDDSVKYPVCPLFAFSASSFLLRVGIAGNQVVLRPSGRGEAGRVSGEAGKLAYLEICEKQEDGRHVTLSTEDNMIVDNEYLAFTSPASLRHLLVSTSQQRPWTCMGTWGPEWDDFADRCGHGVYPLLRTMFRYAQHINEYNASA